MECTLCLHCSSPCRLKQSTKRNGELAVAPIQTRKAVVAEHSLKSRKRVLEVEDDPDIREMVSKLLLSEGYEVVSAVHGQDALEKMEGDFRPDVILLDLMMPVVPTQKSIRALAPLEMSSLCFAGLPRGQVCPTDNGNQRAGSRWRSRRQACGSSFAAGEVAASQAARRSYRWWSPPRIGRPTIFTPRSGRWTSLRSGASLLSERWVRVLL